LRTGRDDVEIRERGLDHHHVGALGEVEADLFQRFARVRWVHLVRAAVAELRCALRGVAEGPYSADAYFAE
jgi:hypothetical protein